MELIFEDIAQIINGRKGIFVAKRNATSFIETTKFIMTNYLKIQKDIEQNNFPLEKNSQLKLIHLYFQS